TTSQTNETPRLEIRRACGNTLSSSNEHGLPSDLLDKAVTRLGWVALFYAVALQAVHWGRQLSVLVRLIYPGGRVLLYAGLFGGTILALAVTGLAWSRKVCSPIMLDLGLVFEVAGAFSIGLVEYSINLPIGERVYGWSGIVLWIAVFVLVIPATLGKTAIASISSILMGPIALLLYGAIYQRSAPDLTAMAAVFVPHFLFALLALILSRLVYRLC